MKFTYSAIEAPENCVKSVERQQKIHQNDRNSFLVVISLINLYRFTRCSRISIGDSEKINTAWTGSALGHVPLSQRYSNHNIIMQSQNTRMTDRSLAKKIRCSAWSNVIVTQLRLKLHDSSFCRRSSRSFLEVVSYEIQNTVQLKS